MRSQCRQNGIIEIRPESEVEVYALRHFIKSFSAGNSSIEIFKSIGGVERTNIKVDIPGEIVSIRELN